MSAWVADEMIWKLREAATPTEDEKFDVRVPCDVLFQMCIELEVRRFDRPNVDEGSPYSSQ